MKNPRRTATLAVAACAIGLSLAACDVTTTTSPVPSTTSSVPGTTSVGSTVTVDGPLKGFPIPPGAQVLTDNSSGGHYSIVFGSVSPSQASAFYTTALPRAGYTIISASSATGNSWVSFSGTGIWFQGHGYNGQIGALSSFDLPGLWTGGNTVEITLTPQ